MPVTWTCPDCEAVQVDDFAEYAQVECRSCGLVILWTGVLTAKQYDDLMEELDARHAADDAYNMGWKGCWYDDDSGEEDE